MHFFESELVVGRYVLQHQGIFVALHHLAAFRLGAGLAEEQDVLFAVLVIVYHEQVDFLAVRPAVVQPLFRQRSKSWRGIS